MAVSKHVAVDGNEDGEVGRNEDGAVAVSKCGAEAELLLALR